MSQVKDLSRKERMRLAQREEILAKAIELFSAKGYSKVSMHEIAQAAEFAIGTLYKFFTNKEDLYKAILYDGLVKFHAALTAALDGPDQEIQKLRNYIRVKSKIFRANVGIVKIYFSETAGARVNVRAGFDSDAAARRREVLQRLASVFESGMKNRRFKRIADPFHLAVALENITNAFLFLWIEDPQANPYPEDDDAILDILMKGLV